MYEEEIRGSDYGLDFDKQYKIVIQHFGPDVSAVFGVIVNYSNKTKKCCQISESYLGNLINVSYKTVNRCIKKLLDEKLIEEVPNDSSAPKAYKTKWYRPIFKNVYALYHRELVKIHSNEVRVIKQEEDRNKLNKKNVEESAFENLDGTNSITIKNSDGTICPMYLLSDGTNLPMSLQNYENTWDNVSPKKNLTEYPTNSKEKEKKKEEVPTTSLKNNKSTFKNLQKNEELDELHQWIMESYEIEKWSNLFEIILEDLYHGKRKNQKRIIRKDWLLECWKEVFEKLEKRKNQWKRDEAREKSSIDWIRYDLSVLVVDYIKFAERKENELKEKEVL